MGGFLGTRRAWVNERGMSSCRRRVQGAGSLMRIRIHSRRVVLLSGLFLYTFLSPAVKADQIVLLVDEQGHRVYINTGEPTSGVDWITRSFRPGSFAASSRSSEEIDQLVAFLFTLTDVRFAAENERQFELQKATAKTNRPFRDAEMAQRKTLPFEQRAAGTKGKDK